MPLSDPSLNEFNEKYWDDIKAARGIPTKENINYFSNYYRFGVFDPYHEIQTGREFLFFTKPDLYICQNNSYGLQPDLANYPFFVDLIEKYPYIVYQLQYHYDPDKNPFSFLLSNMATSSVDLPGLTASTVSTPVNIFGTSYDYRWSSEASDDNHQFSIEFTDTKYLDTYMFFRTYEEYERLKAQGIIKLYNGGDHYKNYIFNKVLHDQFGIYKFIVSEDMETIIHYSYFCGCMFTSLPRDSFNDANFDDGIKYAIDIKCALVEDMNPAIISDFNKLISNYNRNFTKVASIFDFENDQTDLLPVASPVIISEYESTHVQQNSYNNRLRYKLKWYRK